MLDHLMAGLSATTSMQIGCSYTIESKKFMGEKSRGYLYITEISYYHQCGKGHHIIYIINNTCTGEEFPG